MFGALGRVASRRPWFIIAGWLFFAGLVLAFAPALEATTDQSEFLPSDYESIQAAELQAEAFDFVVQRFHEIRTAAPETEVLSAALTEIDGATSGRCVRGSTWRVAHGTRRSTLSTSCATREPRRPS